MLAKKSYSHQYSLKRCSKHASRIERYTSVDYWSIDEVEKVQRQSIASFIGHVFQLTYASMADNSFNKRSWTAESARKIVFFEFACFSKKNRSLKKKLRRKMELKLYILILIGYYKTVFFLWNYSVSWCLVTRSVNQ